MLTVYKYTVPGFNPLSRIRAFSTHTLKLVMCGSRKAAIPFRGLDPFPPDRNRGGKEALYWSQSPSED